MRRGQKKTKSEYINIRISQLREDAMRASDHYDRNWYYRMIQELKWVLDHEQ